MYQNQGMNNGNGMAFAGNPIPQLLSVRIDGEKIIQIGMQEQLIGYTKKAYEEAVSLSEDYEKLLIEHGIIEKERTPEDLMKDLSSKMDRILSSMTSLDGRVSKLEKMVTEPAVVPSEVVNVG